MSVETIFEFGLSLLSSLSKVGEFFMQTIEIGNFGSVSVLQLFGASLLAVVSYKVVRWFI